MTKKHGGNVGTTTDDLRVPERIVLAGDMALHFGIAIGSTNIGYVDSFNFDARKIRKSHGIGGAVEEAANRIEEFARQYVTDSIDVVAYEHATTANYGSNLAQDAMIASLLLAGHRLLAEPKPREYYPVTIKKRATGSGRAEKPDMIKAASEWVGRAITDDNEADAVCLLKIALHDEHYERAELVAKALNF